jgi:hypothetical protein
MVRTMKFLFGFFALTLWQATTVYGGGTMDSCDEQAGCISISRVATKTGKCGDCTIHICLTFNLGTSTCAKGATDTVSHVCTKNKDTTPEQCFPDPFVGFEIDTDQVTTISTNTRYCVDVKPGEPAVFFIADGGTCTAYAGTTPLPFSTTCAPTSTTNPIPSCSGNKEGKECVWTIPTTGLQCDDTDPRARGDPHFLTWHGEKYDYHGACDLVLLHSDKFDHGLGMDIHIRTKHRGPYSYITSAALRIGDEILEVTGQDGLFYLNGEANVALPSKITGYRISYNRRSDFQQTYLVHLHNKQTVVIKTWHDLVSVSIENGKEEDFGDAVGLMGDFATGHKRARDGHVMEDVNAFGQEWQVREDELKLFQTLKLPQHPQQCVLPPAKTEKRRRLGEGISEVVAKAACAHVDAEDFDFCVYDVLVTNDIGSAGAY